jgi:hypothetical protein
MTEKLMLLTRQEAKTVDLIARTKALEEQLVKKGEALFSFIEDVLTTMHQTSI